MEKRVWEKLEKIDDRLGQQEVHLGKLTVSVEEHVRRTNALEDYIKKTPWRILTALSVLAAILEVIHKWGS
jgi:hypothetical protein